jgi:hypothetical protein
MFAQHARMKEGQLQVLCCTFLEIQHFRPLLSKIVFLKEWHFYAGRRRFRISPAKYNRREGEKKKEACFAVNSIPDFFIRKA